MFSIFHNKTVLTVAGLLLLGTVIGSLHNRRIESGRSFAPSGAIRTVMAPGNYLLHTLLLLGEKGVHAARPRYSLLKENEDLRRQVRRLSRENALLREADAENARLRTALGLRESLPMDLLPANVISRAESSWFDTATIDRGGSSGVTRGWAVIDHRGRLVGQVLETDRYTSQIVSINDSTSEVSGTLQRSRHSGIVRGQGADHPRLSYLPKDADVKPGDVVVSAGLGKMIPRGFPIGRVTRIIRNSTAGTTAAVLRPSVRFDQVEQVFVVRPVQAPR